MIAPDSLVGELVAAGVVPSPDGALVERLNRSPRRLDYATQENFRVSFRGSAVCHLAAGRDLAGLRARTEAFAEACPSITCPPLFWLHAGGADLLGTEYFDGRSLASLVAEGRITPAGAVAHADRVVEALEATLRPSTAQEAARELHALFDSVSALPLFNELDAGFLREVVFPYVRKGAQRGPFPTRWTNGDFNAENVLLDSDGDVRLVDYEFAGPTHFFAEDWWRWETYSQLPPDAPGVPRLQASLPGDGGWLEAYFILRQLTLAHETHHPGSAFGDASLRLDRLASLMAENDPRVRASELFKRLGPQSPEQSRQVAMAQLYWSYDGSYCEDCSRRVEYPAGRESVLRFSVASDRPGPVELRLDPAMTPGIVTISRLRVMAGADQSLVMDLRTEADWKTLRLGAGLALLRTRPALTLLSLSSDPFLFLPPIGPPPSPCAGFPGGTVLEATLSFTPDLSPLRDLIGLGS
jgi:hypothetical protein